MIDKHQNIIRINKYSTNIKAYAKHTNDSIFLKPGDICVVVKNMSDENSRTLKNKNWFDFMIVFNGGVYEVCLHANEFEIIKPQEDDTI